MSKLFYDHLIVVDEIIAEIDKFGLTTIERKEMIELVDQTITSEIITVILEKIPEEKHEDFLRRLHNAPHDPAILDYVRNFDPQIEKLIREHSEKIKKELLAEIKRSA